MTENKTKRRNSYIPSKTNPVKAFPYNKESFGTISDCNLSSKYCNKLCNEENNITHRCVSNKLSSKIDSPCENLDYKKLNKNNSKAEESTIDKRLNSSINAVDDSNNRINQPQQLSKFEEDQLNQDGNKRSASYNQSDCNKRKTLLQNNLKGNNYEPNEKEFHLPPLPNKIKKNSTFKFLGKNLKNIRYKEQKRNVEDTEAINQEENLLNSELNLYKEIRKRDKETNTLNKIILLCETINSSKLMKEIEQKTKENTKLRKVIQEAEVKHEKQKVSDQKCKMKMDAFGAQLKNLLEEYSNLCREHSESMRTDQKITDRVNDQILNEDQGENEISRNEKKSTFKDSNSYDGYLKRNMTKEHEEYNEVSTDKNYKEHK